MTPTRWVASESSLGSCKHLKGGKGSVVGASKESQGVESLGIGRTTSSHAAGTLPNRLETGTKGCMAGTKQCNVAVILVCLKHEVAAALPS